MKYSNILSQTFNTKLLTELEASSADKQKIIQSIIDYAKKNGYTREEIIDSLDEIKKSREGGAAGAEKVIRSIISYAKNNGYTSEEIIQALDEIKKSRLASENKPEDSQEPSPVSSTEDELPENKKPEPYSSMMGDPQVISDLSTLFKTALSLVVWIVSKENDKAGAVLAGLNGGISSGLDKINDLVKKGATNAETLNKELKSSFIKLRNNEALMNKTYATLDEKAKAAGKNTEQLIADARENRNINEIKKNADPNKLNSALDKWKKSKKSIDQNFESTLARKEIPNYNNLLNSATNSKDPNHKESEKKLIEEIKKYLLGSGRHTYPYLSEVVDEKDRNDTIKKSLIELRGKTATPLHMSSDEVAKFKEASASGEMNAYFLAEKEINNSLDSLANLYLTIKKKVDIREIQNKTKLSARTINNWIKHTKENPYNDNIIKAIGNQKAQ